MHPKSMMMMMILYNSHACLHWLRFNDCVNLLLPMAIWGVPNGVRANDSNTFVADAMACN